MFTNEDIRKANERYAERLRTEPHITKAHYDRKLERVIVSLSNHAWFAFRPQDAQGLENAGTKALEHIEISPMKYGLHFPELDAHLDIAALMQGQFGTRKWMAARAEGAAKTSRTRTKTSAQSTGKVGRPRKFVAS